MSGGVTGKEGAKTGISVVGTLATGTTGITRTKTNLKTQTTMQMVQLKIQLLRMRAAVPMETTEGEGEENLQGFQTREKMIIEGEEMDAGILVTEKKTMITLILKLQMHRTEIKVDKITDLQTRTIEEAEEGAVINQTEEEIIPIEVPITQIEAEITQIEAEIIQIEVQITLIEVGVALIGEQIILIRTGQLRTPIIIRCIWSTMSNTTTLKLLPVLYKKLPTTALSTKSYTPN